MTGGAPPDRHLITIEPVSLGERSYRYGVTYDGRVLIESSRVPALDACRVLLASPASWKSGGKAWPDMQLEIEAGAKLTVIETEKEGLTLCAVAAVLRCHARCGFLLYGQPADARERNSSPGARLKRSRVLARPVPSRHELQ